MRSEISRFTTTSKSRARLDTNLHPLAICPGDLSSALPPIVAVGDTREQGVLRWLP